MMLPPKKMVFFCSSFELGLTLQNANNVQGLELEESIETSCTNLPTDTDRFNTYCTIPTSESAILASCDALRPSVENTPGFVYRTITNPTTIDLDALPVIYQGYPMSTTGIEVGEIIRPVLGSSGYRSIVTSDTTIFGINSGSLGVVARTTIPPPGGSSTNLWSSSGPLLDSYREIGCSSTGSSVAVSYRVGVWSGSVSFVMLSQDNGVTFGTPIDITAALTAYNPLIDFQGGYFRTDHIIVVEPPLGQTETKVLLLGERAPLSGLEIVARLTTTAGNPGQLTVDGVMFNVVSVGSQVGYGSMRLVESTQEEAIMTYLDTTLTNPAPGRYAQIDVFGNGTPAIAGAQGDLQVTDLPYTTTSTGERAFPASRFGVAYDGSYVFIDERWTTGSPNPRLYIQRFSPESVTIMTGPLNSNGGISNIQSNGLAYTCSSSRNEVWRTQDAGTTWTQIQTPDEPTFYGATGNTLIFGYFIGIDAAIGISSDRGVSFDTLTNIRILPSSISTKDVETLGVTPGQAALWNSDPFWFYGNYTTEETGLNTWTTQQLTNVQQGKIPQLLGSPHGRYCALVSGPDAQNLSVDVAKVHEAYIICNYPSAITNSGVVRAFQSASNLEDIFWSTRTNDGQSAFDEQTLFQFTTGTSDVAVSPNGMYIVQYNADDDTMRVLANVYNNVQFSEYCTSEPDGVDSARFTSCTNGQTTFCNGFLSNLDSGQIVFDDPHCNCLYTAELFNQTFNTGTLTAAELSELTNRFVCVSAQCQNTLAKYSTNTITQELSSDRCTGDIVLCSSVVNATNGTQVSGDITISQGCGGSVIDCSVSPCPAGSTCIDTDCLLTCTDSTTCPVGTSCVDEACQPDSSGGGGGTSTSETPSWVWGLIGALGALLLIIAIVFALYATKVIPNEAGGDGNPPGNEGSPAQEPQGEVVGSGDGAAGPGATGELNTMY